MKHRFTLGFIALSCLIQAGCAGTALRPDDTVAQEIQELRARVVELQRKAAVNEVEMARLRQQVADLEAARGGAPRPSPNSSSSSLGTTAPRVPAPPARVPEPQRPAPPTPAPSAPTPRAEERAETVEPIEEVDLEIPEPAPAPPRRTTPPAPAPAPAQPSNPAPAPSTPAPSTPAPAGDDTAEALPPAAQVLYDRGYALYHQGHFVDAESSFQRFLQANPASELADNAQYWIGECRYARGDLRGALAAFRETVERHPKGNKVPDALLKAGQSLEALGDVEGARVTYREVVRRFPGTAAAVVAEERRAKLP